MGGVFSAHEVDEKYIQNLFTKSEWRKPLWMLRHIREIRLNLNYNNHRTKCTKQDNAIQCTNLHVTFYYVTPTCDLHPSVLPLHASHTLAPWQPPSHTCCLPYTGMCLATIILINHSTWNTSSVLLSSSTHYTQYQA
jgi:hypothetical protein